MKYVNIFIAMCYNLFERGVYMKQNLIHYLESHLNEFTESEKIIARYFIKKRDIEKTKIIEISKELFISTASISRFVNKIGYKNYKEFIYEFQNSLEELAHMAEDDGYIVNVLWKTHKQFYEEIYASIGSIDLKNIANKLLNSQKIYLYSFGNMVSMMDLFNERLQELVSGINQINYYEHLIQKLNDECDYHHLLVIFYQNPIYEKSLKNIIEISKEKYVPIIIITISSDLSFQNYAYIAQLYPSNNDANIMYSISYYTPFLVFIDALYHAIKIHMEHAKKIYTGYF